MKKLSLFAMAAAICAISSNATFAEEMEKPVEVVVQAEEGLAADDLRANLYFNRYNNNISSDEKGYVEAKATASVTNRVDEVEIRIQLQKYDGGWKNVGSEYSTSSTQRRCEFLKSIRVTSGVEYRIKCYYDAYVDGEIVETKTLTTDGVVAK